MGRASFHPFDDPGHIERVAAVVAAVRARPPGLRLATRKRTPTHTIHDRGYRDRAHMVDVSALEGVLFVDAHGGEVAVEGQVTLGALCAKTLESGTLPCVIPEFDDFTVAGLIAGEGIQSSSHRYGLFTHAVLEPEVVTGDGRVVRASASEQPDLFAALPCSHGCLGIITGARLRLRPARRFVASTYLAFASRDDYLAAFEMASRSDDDFVEGVVYGPRHYALIRSHFVDDPAGPPRFEPFAIGGPYYFQHVRARTERRSGAPFRDVLETRDYPHRSLRGVWWMTECHTGVGLLTGTRWGRRVVDSAVREEFQQHGTATPGLSMAERERCIVLQDVGVRIERLGETLDYIESHLGDLSAVELRLSRQRVHGQALFHRPFRRRRDLWRADRPGLSTRRRDARAAAVRGPAELLGGVVPDARRARRQARPRRGGPRSRASRLRCRRGVGGPRREDPRERSWRRRCEDPEVAAVPHFGPDWRLKPAAWVTLAVGTLAKKAWAGTERLMRIGRALRDWAK